MNIFAKYFASLEFTYFEEKQNYAIYVAGIDNMIGADMRQYIIAFVPAHLALQKKARLSELPWKNLQARMCNRAVYNKIPLQGWKIPANTEIASSITLCVTDRKTEYSIYKAKNFQEFPFEVLMIHEAKKRTIYQYPNEMNLHWAIDKFQTIFNYIGDNHPIMFVQNTNTNTNVNTNVNTNIFQPPPLTNPMEGWFKKTQNLIENPKEEDLIEFL
jgi:hypothetical protein